MMENPEKQNHFSPYIIITSLVFILIAWKLLKRSKSRKMPPGPPKLPIIGNMLQVGNLPHRELRDLAVKYGPVMHLQVGEICKIVISTPEAAKEVLRTHDLALARRPFVLAAHVVWYESTDIIYAPFGAYWRQLRKFCITELLSNKRVESYRPIRQDEARSMVKGIAASYGKPVNITSYSASLSLNISSISCLGKLEKEQEDRFMEILRKFAAELGGFKITDYFPSIKFLPRITGVMSRLESLHKAMDSLLEEIMSDYQKRKAKVASKGEAEVLLDVLLNLQKKTDNDIPITRNNVKAVIMDMFLAGTASSSSLIDWAMAEMMRNPSMMKKAQEEVRQVFKGKETVDESDLDKLDYVNLIIKETMRMYPPGALLVPREAGEPLEINGYEIPEKSEVIVNVWALGRDPNYWTEPDKFIPERFIDNPTDYKGAHLQFIPFGAGRRICPGITFGMRVIELGLASLLFHFDWEFPDGVNAETLDMSEFLAADLTRLNNLYLVPVPHHPPLA